MNKEYNFIVKLTTSCPGNCKCCKNRQENFKYKNENNNFFDIDVFRKICKNIKKLNGSYICLSGGEPTIIPNLSEYIQIAHNEGLATRINTNGWNVTEYNLEQWLNLGLDQIVLSIYGVDENTIKRTRGSAILYKKAMEAIEVIKKLKRKYKFIFIVQTVIMKDNYKQIPEILELAIRMNADLFWPSYLEDAINLPEIRLNTNEIKEFKKNIIPRMKKVIIDNLGENIHEEMLNDVDKYYYNEFENYVYHSDDVSCHWLGKHFTFYPNGNIDPCPGHEYFSSDCQFHINYDDIDQFMTIKNLKKNKKSYFEYCKYCPQGVHQELSLSKTKFHEHSRKDDIDDL